MTLRLTRLDARLRITNDDGTPTQQNIRLDQAVKEAIEAAFAELQNQVADIAAALAAATLADSKATAAARESARINSYTVPTNVLSSADAGSDATITVDPHKRVYPVQGSIDVADVDVAGGTITGLPFSTGYYVYYDDPTLADDTPAYQATTDAKTAQVGAAAGRHFVGYVMTPADGGGSTGGSGGSPPGGGGGHPIP